MEDYNYIVLLVEDASGSILVNHIMNKYIKDKPNFDFIVHSFKGIGKIPLKVTHTSQIKTRRLLTDLPLYLKGISSRLKDMPGKKAIFVILDCDDENCSQLKQKVVKTYQDLKLPIEVYFCIAIEEMEAWLLGDSKALLRAYPAAKLQLLNKYDQDSIIGTWEYLADIIYKGGVKALKGKNSTYYEIGNFKCECARNIGALVDIRNNKSCSFNYFIKKLDSFYNNTKDN